MQRRLGTLVPRLRAARARRHLDPALDARLGLLLDLAGQEHGADVAAPDEPDPLADLAAVFSLAPLDLDLVTVAAAPDLDANLGGALALLAGDPARTRPGAGLALELGGGSLLSPADRGRLRDGAPLLRHGLLELAGDEPWPQRPLRVPDRVLAALVGDPLPDPVLRAALLEVVPVPGPQVPAAAKAVLAGGTLVWVRTRPGAAALGLAVAVLDALGVDALVVDLARLPADQPLAALLRALVREAGLLRRGLVLAGADLLTSPETCGLLPLLAGAPVPVLAVASRSWHPAWLPDLPLSLEAAPTPATLRAQLWQEHLAEAPSPELLALRLTPEEVGQAGRHAALLATARDQPVDDAVAREASRRLSADVSRARRGRAAPTFEDLVLPPAALLPLRELVSWARHRDRVLGMGPLAGKGDKGRGIAALFAGSPGTGKTLAAQVVAAELGLELHTVELSSLVDKYIGETEKNLERVFSEAEALNVLLFFDEADALFGSRSEVKDARDRYANQEVSYLLQRMEQFDGLAVLATNLRGNLDAAFSRRLHFVVHFPDPDVPTRRALWEAHLAAVPVQDPDDPVDVQHLAEKVEVSGGDVRNVVLAAAYASVDEEAPLGMRHVLRAVEREYRKLGRRTPVPGLRTV